MAQIKRGGAPGDARDFSEGSVRRLKTAARHIQYLVNEGYAIKNASVFVGNHFLLSERQRLALVRSISSEEQLRLRRGKECRADDLRGKTVHIDGFNTIITLEVALCQSILIECMDGAIRDLAGLRGSYRLIGETREAAGLIAAALKQLEISKAVFYLDAPVSNSGRLKTLIADVWENYPAMLDIQVIHDVDRILQQKDYVISTDSVILDRCKSWFNLISVCLKDINANPVKLW